MPRKSTSFKPGAYYYLCNIGNTGESIFDGSGNHRYFKQQLSGRMGSLLEIVAWCLIQNQYHLIVRIKSAYRLRKLIKQMARGDIRKITTEEYSRFISERIGGMLGGYAKAYNKMNNRKGSLFRESFTKIELKTSQEAALFTKAVLQMELIVKERDVNNLINSTMVGIAEGYKREEEAPWHEEQYPEQLNENKIRVRSKSGSMCKPTDSDRILDEVEEEINYIGLDIERMMETSGKQRLSDVFGKRGEKYWEKMMELRVKTLARKLIKY